MRRDSWRTSAATLLLVGSVAGVCLYRVPKMAHAGEGKQTAPYTTWHNYEGTTDSAQYSALKQINRTNAAQLKQVWFYPAGNNGFRYGSNPIIVDNEMYVIGKDNNIVALNATTGAELWVHDTQKPHNISHRGVSYWESKDRSDRRLLFSTDNMLREIDAKTGKTIESFGNNGSVDLREGLGRVPSSIRQIQSGTPGRVFENLLLLGSATGEEYESPPGDLRAFDILTGKVVWAFHTVPHPGEMGYDTWPPDAWKYVGGTNTWGDISVDEKRAIAYFPVGSPTYDFYGADRLGANLFSDCLLALDARTGKYIWHFQTTHHDLWDYDLEASPKLMTIQHNGKSEDVVTQAGKNGFVYVFDRVTGKPVYPIEERPVLQSDVPGEKSWPTQPFPTVIPPFARQHFGPEDVNPYISNPVEREKIKAEVAASRHDGIYTPPSLGTTMEIPGNNGGANWGSVANDPTTGMLYVQSKDAPSMLKLEPRPPRREMTGSSEARGHLVYIQNCQMCHTASLAGQPPSIPSLVNVIDRVGAERVLNAVHNGLPPMPAFPDLNDQEVKNLLAYLKAPKQGDIPADILARMMAPAASKVVIGQGGQRYWTGYGYMNSSEGLPALSPPWSSLTAYDINTGQLKWKIPLGGVKEMTAKGIHGTGGYWPRGGPVVTAGGLILAPTLSDNTLHIYDKDTGKQVSEILLPVGPEGIPAVYEVAGREFIVVSARPELPSIQQGDGNGFGAPEETPAQKQARQGYYVFALPERNAK